MQAGSLHPTSSMSPPVATPERLARTLPVDRIHWLLAVGLRIGTGGMLGAFVSNLLAEPSVMRDVLGVLAGSALVLWCARRDGSI